jgi:phenylacetate-CoA ligase
VNARNPVRRAIARFGHEGAFQRVRDVHYAAARRALRDNEWSSPEEVGAIQRRKLSALVDHAYGNVPFWRCAMDERGLKPRDIRGPEDLQQLPVLTKQLVQARREELRATALDSRGRVTQERTGGSTGNPLVFEHDARFWSYGRANLARCYEMCGWRAGDGRAWLWATDDSKLHETRIGRAVDWATNQCFLDSLVTSEAAMAEFAQRLERFHPRLLIGYVSALVAFAEVVAATDAQVRPDAIQASAETLTEPERILLESTFACPVFDRYGSREALNIAHECKTHQGLHVFDDLHVVEVLDGERPAAPGVPGRVVLTILDNYAMPFIRYEIGDVAVRAGTCPCGRPFPLLARLEGRVTDLVVSPSGRILQDEFFTRIVYKQRGIRRFQVVQHSPERLRMMVVPGPDFAAATLDGIRREILTRGDPLLLLDFEVVQEIPRAPSGKLRTTISSVSLADLRTRASEEGPYRAFSR